MRKPKIHLVDSGIAAHLSGLGSEQLRRVTESRSGALLETFVVGEVLRQLTWSAIEASAYHWRDRDGAEVDLVLERNDGDVVGVGVKAAVDVDAADFRGLRLLRDRLGNQFRVGVVVHCGQRIQRFEDRLFAIPVSALWASFA